MKITKRDLQISMALIGVLAAAFSYFFVFTKLQVKTEEIKAQNVILEQQASFLEMISLKKEQYLADTQAFLDKTNAIVSTYDNGYTREDSIMYLYNLQKAGISDVAVNSISMAVPEAIVPEILTPEATAETQTTDPAATVNPDGTPVTADTTQPAAAAAVATDQYTPKIVDNGISLYKVPTTIGFLVSYNGFKNVMDYMYSMGGHKSIDSVTLAFDNTTGKLTCSANLNMYFMTGTNQTYEPEFIPSMATGTDNIFKTVEPGNITSEVVTEETAADAEE